MKYPYEECPPCEQCGLDPYDCECPECEECGICGVKLKDGLCADCRIPADGPVGVNEFPGG